jgi:hypothetical protein
MRTMIVVAVSAVLATAAGVRAQEYAVAKRVPLEVSLFKGAPYSAEIVTESLQVLADGNRIVQRTTGRVYRSGEGQVRREEDRPSGTPAISITDPVAGVSYSLDPESRVAWKARSRVPVEILKEWTDTQAKYFKRLEVTKKKAKGAQAGGNLSDRRELEPHERDAEKVAAARDAAKMAAALAGGRVVPGRGSEQHREEMLEARTIEGVRAEGFRRTTTIPAGAIGNDLPIVVVSEEWRSPDLKVLLMTHRTDPRNGESSYRLINIVRAEPDPSLFQVPPDYTVQETGIKRKLDLLERDNDLR